MRALSVCLALLPLLWISDGHAASMALDRDDCASILERWANDPKSVPKRLVDQCKEQMAGAEAAPRTWPAPAAGVAASDPCSGPGAAGSVLCWGPWAELAPAAEGQAPALSLPETVAGYEPRPELAEAFEPDADPETAIPPLPLGSCVPGTPCGFATVVDGVDSTGDAEDTIFAKFDMAADGTSFTVAPAGDAGIDSVADMAVNYEARPDEYQNLFAEGISGDEYSALAARVIRNEEGEAEVAADIWTRANLASLTGKSGYFAWGRTTTQAGLDALNTQGATVSFSGPMSVDNRTVGSMTLNFGTKASWSGNWVNPGYNFSAGGPLTGVDLVSDGNKFSANVLPDSVVQGALLGQPGNQSIAHIIDVNLSDKGRIKDVGLLRQVLGATPQGAVAASP